MRPSVVRFLAGDMAVSLTMADRREIVRAARGLLPRAQGADPVKTFWICVAHRFAVPPVECGARGDAYTAGDRHCRETGHPIVTTTVQHLADRLAGPSQKDSAA